MSIFTRSGNSSRHPSHQVAQKLISSGRVSFGSRPRIFLSPSRSISRTSTGLTLPRGAEVLFVEVTPGPGVWAGAPRPAKEQTAATAVHDIIEPRWTFVAQGGKFLLFPGSCEFSS